MDFDWGTVLQIATVLSLLTPLALAIGRWLNKRKNQPISDAQVVQGMTLTLAEGQDRRISQLVEDLERVENERDRAQAAAQNHQRDKDLMHDTIEMYREIFRANGIAIPRTPQENRALPREA